MFIASVGISWWFEGYLCLGGPGRRSSVGLRLAASLRTKLGNQCFKMVLLFIILI